MTAGERRSVGADTGYQLSRFPVLVFAIPGNPTIIWNNKSDGLYRIEGQDSLAYLWVAKVLPYPASVGDSVNVAGQIIKVASLIDPVAVPAGVFTCVRYDVSFVHSSALRGQIYVAPNVGIVASWTAYGPSLRYVDELSSYQLH